MREIATPDGHLRDLAAGCLYQHDRYRDWVTAMTLDLDDTGRMRRIELRFRGWSDRSHWHDDDSLYRNSIRSSGSPTARGDRSPWRCLRNAVAAHPAGGSKPETLHVKLGLSRAGPVTSVRTPCENAAVPELRVSDDDVQLDRRFLELKSSEEDDVARDLPLFDLRDLVLWDSVLGERCAVILGEAGTGKTTEFHLMCKLLAESGRPAFFLAVEALAAERVASLLGPEEDERLSAWASADTIAYFFLDAVDEARLRNKSLGSALRNLERELREKPGRSRVLISCRVSDWRAQRDRREIHSILLRGDAAQKVKVFALAPLVEAQVVLLAKHYRVGDVEAFMREARRVGAHSYLERPGDVASLVSHWREHGTIGTYAQLIESNVDRKLRESNPERKPSLTPARAKVAATALAGLATLQRKASFVLPDGELDPERAATSLDPHAVLPDLSSGEIVELLTLPLFDEATYGRVRIHHRSVSEYLTARWLGSLMQQGLDPSEVERLLFQQTPSGPAIPPELTSAATWLAAESPFIRDRVMAVAPLVLLEGGDPNSLPDETRRDVLSRLVAQYEGRQRLFRSFDRVALRRLDTSNLAQTINEHLTDPAHPAELINTLLRFVIEGNLEGCASAVTGIAVDSARPALVRADAIEAVGTVGAPAYKEAAVHALSGEQDIDPQIGGAAVEFLFPTPLDVTRLLELLRRSAEPPPDKTTRLARVLGGRVYERTPAVDRARLLSGILGLVQDPETGQARRWLLAPFARLVVAHANACDDEIGRRSLAFLNELARGLTFETRHDLSRRGSDELRALLRSRPDLRRFLFWEQAAQPLPNGRGRPTRYHELPPDSAPLWRLSVEDLDWLERDALSRERISERLLAFDSFVSVQVPDERAEEVRARTERLVASDPALRTRFERNAKRPRYVHPQEAHWQRKRQVLENRQQRTHAADLAWLREHLEEIRSGESQAALIELWHRAPSSDDAEIEVIVGELSEQFDAEIAQAAEEGWRRSWRAVECPLPHEMEARNMVSNTAMIGLAGIAADLRQGLDLASLSVDAATQAARLATHGMNRFPLWIEDLVRYHAPCVEAVFGACIRADYAAPRQHDVLGLLPYAPEPVRDACAPVLEGLIQAGDPPDTDVLEQALEVLLSLPPRRAAVARLAPGRCASYASDLARFALWWAIWFAAEPEAAVESLATQVAADGDRAGDLVLAVCERIWSWLEEDQPAGFGLPEHARALTSLLAIVLTYVHPSGDVRHVGGYSPGARDHAERLRGLLIERLSAIPGQASVEGLVQLANDPRWPEWRDWLLSLAERRRDDDLTVAANDVAAKLLKVYQTHGLAAPEHLAEAGLRTVSKTADRENGGTMSSPHMSHPIFDSLGYPWHRDDAMVAYRALQAAYPQHAEIDLVYRRCAADLPRLSMYGAPAAIWKQALEALAAARALRRLCEIVCSDPAAAVAHPALRQLAAASDIAGPARISASDATGSARASTGHHTLRLLHISDLHLRGPREPDRARRARVLGTPWLKNVTELRGDGRFDLVAFTGDIAFSGQLDEYLELMVRTRSDGTVARWLDETLAAAGCDRDDLYVVPGNHDVARTVHAPAWRKIREEWDRATGPGDDDAFARWLVRGRAAPRGMDAGLRERLLERTAGYRAWVAHGLGRPDLLSTPSRSQLGYRVTRRFARLPFPVHIIGLDSAWLAGDDHDARKLRLTDEQILRLCTGDDGEHLAGLRIALVHHPLADLADGERARRLLHEYRVDLLLSGHLHDPEAREIATPDGHLRDLAAGCLYQHDRYRNGVTAMTLDLDDTGRVRSIKLRFRGWSDRGHWHDDDSLYRGSQGGRLVWPAR